MAAMRPCKRTPIPERALSQIITVPEKANHYTLDEWYLTNRERFRFCDDQRQLADRIIIDSERLISDTADRVETNKLESEHQMDVKVKDIEFLKSSIEDQKKDMDLEIEAMIAYKDRIINGRNALGTKAIEVCKKCLTLREGRLGIDLCQDDVDVELNNELKLLTGIDSLYVRLLEQVNEQIRRLRAMNYLLKRDIEDKTNVLQIERKNNEFNINSLTLALYHGSSALNPAKVTLEEWLAFSHANIERAQKELFSGRPLRAYIDTVMNQIIEDIWKQHDCVNEAFRRRKEEYREAKTKLEDQHFEIVKKVNEITITITKLEKSVAEKEKYMALAHTRLGNRCQRSGNELCKDLAESYMIHEVMEIKDCVTKLQQMLSEANASLRYLLRTQLQLEEDLNIKMNSLKIDEVDCMTLRKGMDLPRS